MIECQRFAGIFYSEKHVNYKIIIKNKDLDQVCAQARDADVVMLDTEFVRIRTFYPQLGLIQLFDGNNLSLIDPTETDGYVTLR